jgi:hypothetical protein
MQHCADSSTSTQNRPSHSDQNNLIISTTSDAISAKDLTFVHDLGLDSSPSATVFKTPSGSSIAIKRDLRRPDALVYDLLLRASHPCITSFSVVDGSPGAQFSIQQEF